MSLSSPFNSHSPPPQHAFNHANDREELNRRYANQSTVDTIASNSTPPSPSPSTSTSNSNSLSLHHHLQYAASAEPSAANAHRQALRRSGGGIGGGGGGGGLDSPHDAYGYSLHRNSFGSGGGGGGGRVSRREMSSSPFPTSTSNWSTHASSSYATAAQSQHVQPSSYAYANLTSHPSSMNSSLPTALHPSAAQLTPLPNFSHSSLGAYQLRIDPEFAGDLYSLRHNSAIGVHQKTAMCLAALEKLANDCIVTHGEVYPESSLNTDQQNTQAIMAMLASPKNKQALSQQQPPEEEQLDGVPLSQHQQALKTTILNLHSMILPCTLR